MSENSEDTWVEVHRARTRADAEQYGLVIVAAGIDCHVVDHDEIFELRVTSINEARARDELAAYIQDSVTSSPPLLPQRSLQGALIGALLYCCLLLFVYGAASRHMFSRDWLLAGQASADLIVEGEWWRNFTALSLHLDGAHLVSNLVVGVFFGILLSRIVGGGLGWLLILFAGGLGNALSAMVQPSGHTAIGASTAVFGALGLVAVLMSKYRASAWTRGARRMVPIAAGVMLLAFLGIQGERIDVGGHIAGFVAGCLLGAGAIAIGEPSVTQHGRVQYVYSALALLLFAGFWLIAFA